MPSLGRGWIIPVAIIIVSCLLMRPFAGISYVLPFLLAISAIACAVLAAGLIQKRLRMGRYDLDALTRLDEEEEVANLDPGTVAEDADRVICMHCNNSYHPRFPCCPRCGQR